MQIIYFPFILFAGRDEINFGGIKLWKFKRCADIYLKDKQLKSKLSSLIELNVDSIEGRPLEDVYIFSYGTPNCNPASQIELDALSEIRLVLFLCTIAKRNIIASDPNAGAFMVSSENFQPSIQNFEIGSDDISFSDGYIVRIQTGGYKVGEVKFPIPPHVLKPLNPQLDDGLLASLLQLKATKKSFYKRILRASEFCYQAYYNANAVSSEARILLNAAAFESLLRLPDNQQRKHFKDKVAKYVVSRGERAITYYSERRGGQKQKETMPRKVKWADKFYTLRNHIVHGDIVQLKDFLFHKQRHSDVALLFFVLLVKKLINERIRRKIFFDEISWEPKETMEKKYSQFLYKENIMQKHFHLLRTNKRAPRMTPTIL